MVKFNKTQLLQIIERLGSDSPQRVAFIDRLLKTGELNEHDLADIMVDESVRNAPKFADAFRSDELLAFARELFHDTPEYLARAMVHLRPDLFWHLGLAYRVVMRINTDLGPVYIPPRESGGGSGGGGRVLPPPKLDLGSVIGKDILELHVEALFRRYLPYFSADPDFARALLDDEITKANEYNRLVLERVRESYDELLTMKFPGVVTALNGKNLFPSVHTRWHIARARKMSRLLNAGDTSTFKTAFGFVGLDYVGAKHVLVICTANARAKHAEKVAQYFENGAERVHVLSPGTDPGAFADAFKRHQFHIVGWPSLADEAVVEMLTRLPFDAYLVDECQYGKSASGNGAAKRAAAFMRLGNLPTLKWIWAMSATPWENRPSEMAAVASLLRPDLFPTPTDFTASRLTESPRLLRELFEKNVLEVKLEEVIPNLPPTTPDPAQNLFNAVAVRFHPKHRSLYQRVHDCEDKKLRPPDKLRLLLRVCMHPNGVRKDLPSGVKVDDIDFDDWELSSKLVWLKDLIDKNPRAKVVIGTGIYIQDITQQADSETVTTELEEEERPWVAQKLREWYGDEAVVVIDGSVAIGRERDRRIELWRRHAKTRVLLVSMPAVPDSMDLTVPAMEGLDELIVTSICSPWKPWKQFLGRFRRPEQGLPLRFFTPILADTVDEDLLRYNQGKWDALQLFRAVPLTDAEAELAFSPSPSTGVGRVQRTAAEHIMWIATGMKGRGEAGCLENYQRPYGLDNQERAFVKAYLATQDTHGSGNVARLMARAIHRMMKSGILEAERILDAACGPLTLERYTGLPVYGIDFSPEMIVAGKHESSLHGPNARVGCLTKLPKEWTSKFLLTANALSLHWTSLAAQVNGVPERVHVLREHVRVTDPHGQLWLVFLGDSMTEETFQSWIDQFRKNGFLIDEPLTGHVQGADGDPRFHCWSLVVTPNGHQLDNVDPRAFSFEFEAGHFVNKKRRPPRRLPEAKGGKTPDPCTKFVVQPPGSASPLSDEAAIERVIDESITRWVEAAEAGEEAPRHVTGTAAITKFGSNWRMLERLRQAGVFKP